MTCLLNIKSKTLILSVFDEAHLWRAGGFGRQEPYVMHVYRHLSLGLCNEYFLSIRLILKNIRVIIYAIPSTHFLSHHSSRICSVFPMRLVDRRGGPISNMVADLRGLIKLQHLILKMVNFNIFILRKKKKKKKSDPDS